MPPRISRLVQPWIQNAHIRTPSTIILATPKTSTTTSHITSCQASTATHRKRHRDPYALAQAKARKTANISRREVLRQERAVLLGDPVRANTTPLVESFDTALAPEPSPPAASTLSRASQLPAEEPPGVLHDADQHLNFFLSKSELESGVRRSNILSTSDVWRPSDSATNTTGEEARKETDCLEGKATAEEALRRISSLSLGSSKDRLRVNKQRCIDIFGRHNTDDSLPARPGTDSSAIAATHRVGPDTGSSEVQVAILTAKIRSLADYLDTRGSQDKMNKRNLRLLVHRRAKLLKYLRKKERGGPRWQHLTESLGLTEGTWKGEISL